jgi:hypothetical protein
LCKALRTVAASVGFNEVDIGVCDADNSPIATSGGSIFVWGADLRLATDAVYPYQRVTTATDYQDIGLPRVLQFDGVDDSLYTASSLNLTATDAVTLVAGVRRNATTTAGMVLETSATVDSNSGVLNLQTPSVAGGSDLAFLAKGTVPITLSAEDLPTPFTRVVTGRSSISLPSDDLRLNGVQLDADGGTQGTGTYGNHVLYVGRRNNASSPFNGALTQLLLRGAYSDDDTVAQTETFTAGKSGVTLTPVTSFVYVTTPSGDFVVDQYGNSIYTEVQ